MTYIKKEISDKILMIGNYYKGDAVGGMASVVRVYSDYFETLHYVSSWRDGPKIKKICYALMGYIRACVLLILFNQYKIVHIHSTSNASFYRKAKFVRIAKFFRKKVVLHMHSAIFMDFYNESPKKEYIVETLKMADTLVVLSKSWKEVFANLGVPSEDITIINNPVCPPVEKSTENTKPVRMLFLGDLRERKGVWDILSALNKNKDHIRDFLEFRIGGNKREEELKKYIKDNKLSDFVKFEGWVMGDKKWKLLNWANLMILPSYGEGLPITLLESMVYSCAMISTPVGGIPEILADHHNGIMVEPGDVDGIAKAIKFFIDDTTKLKEYGEKSRMRVEPYLPSTVFSQLNEVYKKLLAE